VILARHTTLGVAASVLALAVFGCGGGGDKSSATSSPTSAAPTTQPPTTTTGTAAGASQPTPAKRNPHAPSPATCLVDWNHGGATPQLLHVLGPAVRAAGPFPAEIGTVGDDCAIIVHASGIEGGGKITYETRERAPGGGYVQAAVPPLESATPAVLEHDALLRLK
jgi:hypothetical protein